MVKQGTEPMLYKLETDIFSGVASPSDQLFPLNSDYLKLQMCLKMKTHQTITATFLNFQDFRTDLSYSIFHYGSCVFYYTKLALCPDKLIFREVVHLSYFAFLVHMPLLFDNLHVA